MKYEITIRKSAAKALDKLPTKDLKAVVESIMALANNPRPSGCKKLKGKQDIWWRIRVGDYRVIYSVDDTIHIVNVANVGHRRDIYE